MSNFIETISLLTWLAVHSPAFKDCELIVTSPISFSWHSDIGCLETFFKKPSFDLWIPTEAIEEYEKANKKSIGYFDFIPF